MHFVWCMTLAIATLFTTNVACVDSAHRTQRSGEDGVRRYVSDFCHATREGQITLFRSPSTYAAYGTAMDDDVTDTVFRARNGELAEMDNSMHDNEFLVHMQIGTPPQTFWALPDTATPQTWVFGPLCCFAGNHSFFRNETSSTFRQLRENRRDRLFGDSLPEGITISQTATETYGVEMSTLTLAIVNETLTLPLVEHRSSNLMTDDAPSLITPMQTIGVVLQSGDAGRAFRKMEASIGFAPGVGSMTIVPNYATPMENWIRRKNVHKPLVSFTLVKEAHASFDGEGGRMTIGAVDEEVVEGEMTWVQSTATSYWGTSLARGSVRVGDKDVYAINETLDRRMIIDTGSAINFLPAQLAAYANSLLPGTVLSPVTKRWAIDCQYGNDAQQNASHAAQWPYLAIRLADRWFGVPPEDMVVFPTRPIAFDTSSGAQYCLSSIQSGPDGFAVLGNAFLKNHAFTLDYGDATFKRKRIGIANRKDTGIILDSAGKIARFISVVE